MLVDDMVEKIKKLPEEKRREVFDFVEYLLAMMGRKKKTKGMLRIPAYSCNGKLRDFTRADLYEEHI